MTVTFPNGFEALSDIKLTVRPGELIVVLGSNGSGKTTLLRCIAGQRKPTRGTVYFAGQDMTDLTDAALLGIRLQQGIIYPHAPLVGRRNALANVLMGTLGRNRSLATRMGFLPRKEFPLGYACLAKVGLDRRYATRRVDTLSAGEAQRVAIARVLAQKPRALLADEPIANLDPRAADDILSLIRRLTLTERLATLCVLHQPEFATQYADSILGLRAGRTLFFVKSAALTKEHLADLYRDDRPQCESS